MAEQEKESNKIKVSHVYWLPIYILVYGQNRLVQNSEYKNRVVSTALGKLYVYKFNNNLCVIQFKIINFNATFISKVKFEIIFQQWNSLY